MELRIVKKPNQDDYTKLEDLEYMEFIKEDNNLKNYSKLVCKNICI